MKKLALLITAIVLIASIVMAEEAVLKLTAHARVATPVVMGRNGFAEVLVEIQGMIYAVEDTKWRKASKYGVGDIVLLSFSLNETGNLVKLEIID